MDQPVRDNKVDLLSTRNLDFHQRQIKNAAPAVDDDDYVILKQIKDLIANVTANAQGSNQPVITTVGGGSTASAVGRSGAIQFSDGKKNFAADDHFTYDTSSGVLAIQEDINSFPNSGIIAPIFNATGDKDGYIFQAYSPNKPPDFQYPIMMNMDGDISSLGRVIAYGFIFDGLTVDPVTSTGRAVLYYNTISNQILVSYDNAQYVPFGGVAIGIKGAIQLSDGNSKFTADNHFTYDTTSGVMAIQEDINLFPNSGVIAPIFNATGDKDGYIFQAYSPGMPENFRFPIMMNTIGDISAIGRIIGGGFIFDGTTTPVQTSATRAVLYYDTTQNQILVSYDQAAYVPFGGGNAAGTLGAVQFSDGNKKFVADNTFTYDPTSGVLALQSTKPDSGVIAKIFNATGDIDGYVFQAYIPGMPSDYQYPIMMDIHGNIAALGLIASNSFVYDGNTADPAKSTGRAVVYYNTTQNQLLVSYNNAPYVPFGGSGGGVSVGIKYAVQVSDGNKLFLASNTVTLDTTKNVLTLTSTDVTSGITAPIFSATGRSSDGYAFQAPLTAIDINGNISTSNVITKNVYIQQLAVVPTAKSGYNVFYADTGSPSQILTPAVLASPTFNSYAPNNSSTVAAVQQKDGTFKIFGDGHAQFQYLLLTTPTDTQVAFIDIYTLSGSTYLSWRKAPSGTMTAGLKIHSDSTTQNTLTISSTSTIGRRVDYATGIIQRWSLRCTSEAEPGANAGSNFDIMRWDDAGNYISSPISINRATGLVTIPSLSATVTAGADTQVIYNSNGVLTGSANFTYSGTGIIAYVPIIVNGTNCGFGFYDRVNSSVSWTLYATGGLARFFNALTGDVVTITNAGDLTVLRYTTTQQVNTSGVAEGATSVFQAGSGGRFGITSNGNCNFTTMALTKLSIAYNSAYTNPGDGSLTWVQQTIVPATNATGAVLYFDQTQGKLLVSYKGGAFNPIGSAAAASPANAIQYNVSGAFAGSVNFTFNNSNQVLLYGSFVTNGATSGFAFIDRVDGSSWTMYGVSSTARFNYNGVADVITFNNAGVLVATNFASRTTASGQIAFQCGTTGQWGIQGDGNCNFGPLACYDHTIGDPASTGANNTKIYQRTTILTFANSGGSPLLTINGAGGLVTFNYGVTVQGLLTLNGGLSLSGTITASGGFIGPVFNAASAPNNTTAAFQCPGAIIQGNGDSSFGATNFKSITTSAGGTISCAGVLYANGSMTVTGTLNGNVTIDVDQWIRTKTLYIVMAGGNSYNGVSGETVTTSAGLRNIRGGIITSS